MKLSKEAIRSRIKLCGIGPRYTLLTDGFGGLPDRIDLTNATVGFVLQRTLRAAAESELGQFPDTSPGVTQTRSDSRFRVVKIVSRVTMLAFIAIGTANAEPAHRLDTNALCRNILHMIPAHRRLEIAIGSEIVATCQPDMPAGNKLLVYFDEKDLDELVWWETHNEVRVVILGSPDKE